MTRSRFLERLQAGEVLVADGATGTNLQARGMTLGVPGETWVLQNPDAIVQLHRDFIEAGADIVLTCTFGGSAIRLEQIGFVGRMEEVNRCAVELARTATEDVPALVAGSIGPLGHLLKPLGPVEEADAVTAY
ncbi:MAG: homocysteine S-methyltransferase family protein, partial [Anaerolineaceae bacterium]|nr:homocysteine S-methyltransferase family protein [Anaerolineaceae bacterium]